MLYFNYLWDGLFSFSMSTNVVVIGFSLISAYFMKQRIGALVAFLYFPIMMLCAFASNYLFWEHDVFRGDQDIERIFSATIAGMMFALFVIIAVNNLRESYWRRPIGKYESFYDQGLDI